MLGENGHLTVVCGSNVDALRRATEAYGSDPRVSLRAQVTPLTPLIAAADVLVTKSGRLTSTEAMTIGTAIGRRAPDCGVRNGKRPLHGGQRAWRSGRTRTTS